MGGPSTEAGQDHKHVQLPTCVRLRLVVRAELARRLRVTTTKGDLFARGCTWDLYGQWGEGVGAQ